MVNKMPEKNYRNYFKGKKIIVMGLGLLGRGVGDSEFLAKSGAKLTITDLKGKAVLKSSLKKLSKYKDINFVLGKHRKGDFRGKDMILKAAGVPLDSPHIKEAKRNKIPIKMSSSLFAELSGVPVIGITGTRGKSTVAHLIYHILKTAGKKVILGGNIKGISTLSFLPKSKNLDFAVLELDSWQLQGFGEDKFSPHISVFTTFYPDHLDYYASASLSTSMKKYFKDKANIFKYQKKKDFLIAGKQSLSSIKKWGGKIKGKLIIPPDNLPKGFSTNLPGKHNEYNACLAIEVARVLGIPDKLIKKALLSFNSIEGRLELIRAIKGIKIYNDTNSTTPDATVVALQALGHRMSKLKKRIVLIMGGSDKGLDMSRLVKEIPKYCKAVIFLSGTGTDKIKNKIKGVEFYDLKQAVYKAMSITKKGDTILFSPAFASFGMFKNEYDRGDKFVKLVKNLK